MPQFLTGVVTHNMKVTKHRDGTISLRCSADVYWFFVSGLEEVLEIDAKFLPRSYVENIKNELEKALE